MSDIEWTDRTWNPLVGCSRVSEGCRHCYAERFVHRGLAPQRLVEERLGEPLRWKKPARVFVNSLSDLFHEGVSFETIAAVFGVMAAASRHTFQVLTKRPARAREFFEWMHVQTGGAMCHAAYCALVTLEPELSGPFHEKHCPDPDGPWPLPNVWLGVSVEDQRTADERIPVLLDLPAALRFVSYEPALGPVANICAPRKVPAAPNCVSVFDMRRGPDGQLHSLVDWIIVGGESGPAARPFDIAWARSTIEQCRVAGTKCFVKQLGAKPFEEVNHRDGTWSKHALRLRHRKGADPAEWPADLRVREMPT